MVMPESYDRLVDGFSRKLKEAKGNIESKVMTPEETAKEIAEVTEGVFAVAGEPTIVVLDKIENGIGHFHVEPKKKRGRPLGSKNKPKDAKA